MVEHFVDSQFWIRVGQIIGIDILLSGDNALVIALACRALPDRQRRVGVVLGAGAAVALRIVFAIFIVYLLKISFLKLAGGVLLLWIAVKLVTPGEIHGEATSVATSITLWQAVRTVVIADAVMSLDNVVAIAAAARGSIELLVFGLAVSIPLIVYGSTLILKLLDRLPIVITLGGALLGYIAGEVIVSDPAVERFIAHAMPAVHRYGPWACAAGVLATGWALTRHRRQRTAAPAASQEHL